MLHLLLETSSFVSLPNGCLCQMTGALLMNMVPQNIRTMDHLLLPRNGIELKGKCKMGASEDDEKPMKQGRIERAGADLKMEHKHVEK